MGYVLLRASNSLQYREGHEVFSTVTGPVEYGSDHACGSINKLGLGIKHRSNEVLTLQGWWPATSSAESEAAVLFTTYQWGKPQP